MTEALTAKQMGYLRVMPDAGSGGQPADGPRKGAWNRLSFTPYAKREMGGLYRRTPAGDAAVAAFEADVPDDVKDLLGRLLDREVPDRKSRGMSKLVDWQLVFVSGFAGGHCLTSEGRLFAARVLGRGEAAGA